MISPQPNWASPENREPSGSFGDGEILSTWHFVSHCLMYIVVENAATVEHSQSILDDERNSVAGVARANTVDGIQF